MSVLLLEADPPLAELRVVGVSLWAEAREQEDLEFPLVHKLLKSETKFQPEADPPLAEVRALVQVQVRVLVLGSIRARELVQARGQVRVWALQPKLNPPLAEEFQYPMFRFVLVVLVLVPSARSVIDLKHLHFVILEQELLRELLNLG